MITLFRFFVFPSSFFLLRYSFVQYYYVYPVAPSWRMTNLSIPKDGLILPVLISTGKRLPLQGFRVVLPAMEMTMGVVPVGFPVPIVM